MQHELVGLREEAVPGEDRDVLAVGDVAGRATAAQVVVVHRGKVVMDQRIGVDQLDRRRRRQHRLGLMPERACRRQREHRPDPLAAG